MKRLRHRPHQRIKSSGDFARVYREGSRARSGILVVAVASNGRDYSRLGLSVGKRIWKSAVRRNRVRRLFREAFRLSRDQLPTGLDIVLIPAAPRLDPRLEEVRRDLVAMCAKAHRRFREKKEVEKQESGS